MARTDEPASWDKIWKKIKEDEWCLIRNGERSGPFLIEELKDMEERNELNPRLDMVWKEGMDDWIPAGQVDGLFEKNAKAETEEKIKAAPPTEPVVDRSKKKEKEKGEEIEWPGTGRGGFVFFYFIFPILWISGLTLGAGFLQGIVGAGIIGPVLICLGLLPFIIGFAALLSRFQNLSMSRLWLLGMLVPGLNLWLGYRLLTCPPGYAVHKKLGALSIVLAVVYWLIISSVVAASVLVTIKGPAMFEDWIEQNPELVDEITAKIGEAKAKVAEATGGEEAEPEEKEKAPTIIPY